MKCRSDLVIERLTSPAALRLMTMDRPTGLHINLVDSGFSQQATCRIPDSVNTAKLIKMYRSCAITVTGMWFKLSWTNRQLLERQAISVTWRLKPISCCSVWSNSMSENGCKTSAQVTGSFWLINHQFTTIINCAHDGGSWITNLNAY